MKEQLDLRTLIIYLLSKLKQIGVDSEHSTYIRTVSVLLSKQTLFILTQERVKDPFLTLEPKDTSYFLRTFSDKEIAQEIKTLLQNFKNIEEPPYSENIIFQEVQHTYVVSLIESIIHRLLPENYEVK